MTLQRYQWTMTGMREDGSVFGAMWFYRGMNVDQKLASLDAELVALDKELRDTLAELREVAAERDTLFAEAQR